MKKILLLALLIGLTASLSAREIPNGYVDLGLPSGTLWKEKNESGLYTYLSARYYFGVSLPNRGQMRELLYNCTWHWTGKGYRVTGPNDNSIYIRFEGYLDCDENIHDVGSSAHLWTLDDAGDNFAYVCVLTDRGRDIIEDSNCRSFSVRLVISE